MDAELRCRCGAVEGRIRNASPAAVNRLVCYCDDCQAFAQYLGRSDLVDVFGGTDIVQVAPASVSFTRGGDQIVGLRLSAKGLHRWYARCCKTPLGNTLGPAIPFVGIVAQAFGDAEVFGKPRGAIQGRFALGEPPDRSIGQELRLAARAFRMIIGWRLGRKAWPNPFFDQKTGLPNRPLTILSPAERDALRR